MSRKLEPAVARPRLYAGADQPARLSLEIERIQDRGEMVPVIMQDILQLPFWALTKLASVGRNALAESRFSCAIWSCVMYLSNMVASTREAQAKQLVTLHYSSGYQGRGDELEREALAAFRGVDRSASYCR